MPRTTTQKNDNQGVYIHNPLAVAKTVSTSKMGGIRTIISTHQGNNHPDLEVDLNNATTSDLHDQGHISEQDNGPDQLPVIDEAMISGISVKTPAKQYLNSDNPLHMWIDFHDRYLDALLQLDGQDQFEKISLSTLKLNFHLGHGGNACPFSMPAKTIKSRTLTTSNSLSCLPASEDQSPTWMGGCPSRIIMSLMLVILTADMLTSLQLAIPADTLTGHKLSLEELPTLIGQERPFLGPRICFVALDEYLKHLDKSVIVWDLLHYGKRIQEKQRVSEQRVLVPSVARHQMFCATGTGDLQKGEKYSNMDYLLFSALMHYFFIFLLICYNISCQYSKGFFRRLADMPVHFQFPRPPSWPKPVICFKVPKFHLPPHKVECHSPFSLNYTPGVGCTDGEGVERNWAWLNGAALSTSQMGQGSRHDTLDDFMGFWNYKKTVDLGDMLLKKLVEAIPQAIIHCQAFHVFTEGLRKDHLSELQTWEKMVLDWESGMSTVDPYLVEEDSISINEIQHQLAEEDHQNIEHGVAPMEITPTTFILSGLSIEDIQLSLRSEARLAKTDAQKATLQTK
ncbi:hypothetical protein DXG01_003030 [Tephrocybe rancida]|nr:hypothetical protein DXG01_003030 [Tephrocybe rancida]